nr:M50 family metallopeptidase [Candidatus Sigynarchaeum springense]MDO8119316.1 M50 family metallopeptidase [Candidatus Sigynarchaeota archaeon]
MVDIIIEPRNQRKRGASYSRSRFSFTTRETADLMKAWIGLSVAYLLTYRELLFVYPEFIPREFRLFLAVSGLTFVAHELGHKFTAQHFGLEAHFKSNDFMILISFAVAWSGFLFFAPGAVVVESRADRKQTGTIAMAGPLSNITFSLAIIPLLIIFPYNDFVYLCFRINAWLALFNMLPFGMFDGRKIFFWNKVAFGLIITNAGVLVGLSYVLLYFW